MRKKEVFMKNKSEFFIKHNLEWLYRIVKGKRFKRSLKLISFGMTVYASKFKKGDGAK